MPPVFSLGDSLAPVSNFVAGQPGVDFSTGLSLATTFLPDGQALVCATIVSIWRQKLCEKRPRCKAVVIASRADQVGERKTRPQSTLLLLLFENYLGQRDCCQVFTRGVIDHLDFISLPDQVSQSVEGDYCLVDIIEFSIR
jgi:hypothetical protein